MVLCLYLNCILLFLCKCTYIIFHASQILHYTTECYFTYLSLIFLTTTLISDILFVCRSSCSSVRSVPRGCVAMAAVHGWLQCVQQLHRGLLTGAQRRLCQQTPRKRSRLHRHRYVCVCVCSVLMHEQALEMSY